MKNKYINLDIKNLPANLYFLKKENKEKIEEILAISFSTEYKGNFPLRKSYKPNSNIIKYKND